MLVLFFSRVDGLAFFLTLLGRVSLLMVSREKEIGEVENHASAGQHLAERARHFVEFSTDTKNILLQISVKVKINFQHFPFSVLLESHNRGKFQFIFVPHFSPETGQRPVSHQIKRWKSFLAQNILWKLEHCLHVRSKCFRLDICKKI